MRELIGPTGPLTPAGNITASANDQVFEDLEMTGFNANGFSGLEVRNCRIIGARPTGGSDYTVKVMVAGSSVSFFDTEIICRESDTKALNVNGQVSAYFERVIVRGGEDAVFVKAFGSQPFEGYGVIFRECWIGNVQRFDGSHSDALQIERADGVLLERCRIEGFSVTDAIDPLTDPPMDSLASGTIILTQQGGTPTQITDCHVIDCYVVGGNRSIDSRAAGGFVPVNTILQGNRFGLPHNISAWVRATGDTISDNTWAASGDTVCCDMVISGTPVPP